MKLAEVQDQMQKTVESTQRAFNTIRTGRANASLLDRIVVEYYGMETPLKSLATISTPDATTIAIQPFDRTSMGAIEKAISLSDVGLTPSNDGQIIRLNIPPLTSDRRKELVKLAAKLAEEGKVAIRNIRRDAIDAIRKREKGHEISEDESRDLQDQVQKSTDKFIAKIEDLLTTKEKEYHDRLSFFLLMDRTGFLSVLFSFLSLFKRYRGVRRFGGEVFPYRGISGSTIFFIRGRHPTPPLPPPPWGKGN